jgi:hypothetical protein
MANNNKKIIRATRNVAYREPDYQIIRLPTTEVAVVEEQFYAAMEVAVENILKGEANRGVALTKEVSGSSMEYLHKWDRMHLEREHGDALAKVEPSYTEKSIFLKYGDVIAYSFTIEVYELGDKDPIQPESSDDICTRYGL